MLVWGLGYLIGLSSLSGEIVRIKHSFSGASQSLLVTSSRTPYAIDIYSKGFALDDSGKTFIAQRRLVGNRDGNRDGYLEDAEFELEKSEYAKPLSERHILPLQNILGKISISLKKGVRITSVEDFWLPLYLDFYDEKMGYRLVSVLKSRNGDEELEYMYVFQSGQ
jgi:hypothetical protein